MSLHRTGRALRRRSFLCAGAGLLGTAACAGASGAPPVAARPLALAPLPPGSRLEPLGGLVLDSTAIGFGGLSALHLDSALRITAVSDLARWMTARLVLRDGRPMALTELRTGVLRDGAGRPLPRGHTGDSESMARLPDGSWLVGFERWHRIRAYRNLDAPGTYVQMPPGLGLAPANGGLESSRCWRMANGWRLPRAAPPPSHRRRAPPGSAGRIIGGRCDTSRPRASARPMRHRCRMAGHWCWSAASPVRWLRQQAGAHPGDAAARPGAGRSAGRGGAATPRQPPAGG
ncbi:esterase-like activity of phytase family protein [Siccirubricoccus deserti]